MYFPSVVTPVPIATFVVVNPKLAAVRYVSRCTPVLRLAIVTGICIVDVLLTLVAVSADISRTKFDE